MPASTLALAASDFIQLTTFRRTGEGVPTPVWVVPDGDALAVFTPAGTGKLKRIAHTPRVTVAECSRRGRVADDVVPVEAHATDDRRPGRGRPGHPAARRQVRPPVQGVHARRAASRPAASDAARSSTSCPRPRPPRPTRGDAGARRRRPATRRRHPGAAACRTRTCRCGPRTSRPPLWEEVDRADVVVHAGDWVDVATLDRLEARSRSLLACWGNNDGPELRARLPEVARATARRRAGRRGARDRQQGSAARSGCARPTPTSTCSSSGTATSRGTRPIPGCACSTRAHRPTAVSSRTAPG